MARFSQRFECGLREIGNDGVSDVMVVLQGVSPHGQTQNATPCWMCTATPIARGFWRNKERRVPLALSLHLNNVAQSVALRRGRVLSGSFKPQKRSIPRPDLRFWTRFARRSLRDVRTFLLCNHGYGSQNVFVSLLRYIANPVAFVRRYAVLVAHISTKQKALISGSPMNFRAL